MTRFPFFWCDDDCPCCNLDGHICACSPIPKPAYKRMIAMRMDIETAKDIALYRWNSTFNTGPVDSPRLAAVCWRLHKVLMSFCEPYIHYDDDQPVNGGNANG